ncbi:cytochrome-c peroxidase [Larkinella terrae]|uniref:C-type cytochrome n=1 Tax=Larkinella terrae TaxID=2025311 RepID=A0A7K0EDS4_9BACT|nr:cytochrome c peroxidase [Larkinella terrae]MRS59987.1 c-type cytochrome [Larkinella terrae]
MTRWQHAGIVAAIVFYGFAIGCQNDSGKGDPEPEPKPVEFKATPYNWKKPANFEEPHYDFTKNPLTVEGVALGKTLFYDGILSRDGKITCAFCHSPFAGFAHTDHPLSHGINDKIGTRNVPGIENVAWKQAFFWDGGIVDLDLLPISPIQNPVEMGDSLANVLKKVRSSGQYPALFKAAFGTEEVTTERFLKALSQFMLTMVSATSRYDKYIRKEAGATLTDQELRGLALFKQNCSACHAGEQFTDQSYRNNGLRMQLANSKDFDLGRYQITLNQNDYNKFRVPSLRNVELTPPYMHDGRFTTLEKVLDHYMNDVQDTPQLDPLLKKNGKTGFSFTTDEKADIAAFLRTLTDSDFMKDRRFQPD